MAGSVNKAIIVGNLGKDPETKTFDNGGKVVSFSVATSESWKSKDGEKQERTQWHNISILNEGIAGVAERFLKKGSKVYVEGQIENRKYKDRDGNERYITEIVLRPYHGELTLLDSKGADEGQRQSSRDAQAPLPAKPSKPLDDLADDIPW